jgi:glycosyltransferase involved in cell wall biosynthesis
MGWIRPAVKAAVSLSNRKRPDVLWATAGPVSAFTIAQRLSRETGIPYVLDFRDAWTITYNDFDERRPRWAKHFDRRNMFAFLQGAKAIVFRYEAEAECYWRAYNGALDASRIHIIPNGYEGEVDRFTVSRGQKCNILYTGTLPDYRYDSFLQALAFLQSTLPEEARRLNIQFVGEGTESLSRDIEALGLSGLITTRGPMSHDAVTRLSREADALLVLGRAATMRGYELFAAAKLFGYLKAGRPIIGVLPNDEARKILERVGVPTVANVDSISEIVAVLQNVLHRWREEKLQSLVPDPNACRAFSAESQVGRLVRALEGKPASDPFVPGRVDVPISLKEFVTVREREQRRKNTAALHGSQIHAA